MENHIRNKRLNRINIGDADKMSSNEKKISFLNNYFIYKKRRPVNAEAVYNSIIKTKPKTKRKIRFKKLKRKIKLKMRTLDSLLNEKNIDAAKYNHWVMDLQGAELLTFMGATESIKSCRSIYIEISKGDVYKGGAHKKACRSLANSEKKERKKATVHVFMHIIVPFRDTIFA